MEWKSPTTEVTLSYSSADAPVFVASTSADLTGSVSVGMRVRLSQSTGGTKYFIVVAIASNSITFYGGTDYTLNNEAISSPVFSSAKVPVGFPVNPSKWTVEITSTSDQTQSNPTNGTWYNAISGDIPVGAWDVAYYVDLYLNKSSASILDGMVTLSTGNNNESDIDLTARFVSETQVTSVWRAVARKNLVLGSKTTYYLNMVSRQSSITLIGVIGSTNKTIIRAICAYL